MSSILTRRFKNVVVQLSRCSTKTKIRMGRPPGYLAPTSFALYLKDFTEKNPSKAPTDTVMAAAKSWKEIDEELKKFYQEKSKQIDLERKSAYESLSDEDKLKLHDDHEKAADEKKKRKKRKDRRELNKQTGRPKLPPTAFAIFLKEFYKNRSIDDSMDVSNITTVMIDASNAWKELSVNDKEKYRTIAAAHKNEYDEALKVWKATQNQLETKEPKEKKPPKKAEKKMEKSETENSTDEK